MKTYLLTGLIMFWCQLIIAQCIPSVANGGATGDYITSVTFGGLSHLNSDDSPCDYTSYNATATFNTGLSYIFSISTGSATLVQQVWIWIDYNHDNDFSDPGELVFTSAANITSVNPATGTILIPATAQPHRTRMRVACQRAGFATALNTCTNPTFGEYQDYGLIINTTSCNTVPLFGSLQVQSCVSASSTSYLLFVEQTDYSSTLTFAWQRSSFGAGFWIYILSSQGNATVTNLTGYFRCIATCISSGIADTSEIVCPTCAVLPTQLLTFNAFIQNNSAIINWTASNEHELAYYEVERSKNAFEFNSISSPILPYQIQNGSYTFIDKNIFTGNYYYRLKMVDIDGAFAYSNLVHVVQENEGSLQIQPNPFRHQVSVTIAANKVSNATIYCSDILGRTVFKTNTKLQAGSNELLVPASSWNSGIYIIHIAYDAISIQHKIIKE